MKKILFILAAMVLSGIGLHAENTITYEATEKLPGYYGSLEVGATTFGPAITSHEFSNGKGTITCRGEITEIGNEAFRECNGLRTIEIPGSATSIGYGAFHDCSNLTSVTIPNSVTTIGSFAFMYCSGLTSVTIGNSVATIGNWAFDGCTSLTSIEIPKSVTTIEGNAFSNCTNLTSVTVFWTDANSIISIRDEVFYRIANGAGPSGATLYVPKGTSMLYHQANGWKDFGHIIDPNNTITYTASEKLSGYYGSLDVGAFTFGPAITSHDFSNGKGTITCNGDITKFGIGNNSYTSDDIRSLTSINIPNSVTSIIGDAFQHCARLTSIDIPNSVTSIGDRAFWGCGLETMYCYALTPPLLLGASVFYHTSQDMSVYVYDTAAYKSQWTQLPASCFKPISAVVGDFKYEFFGGNKARIVAKEGGYTQSTITIPEQITYDGLTFTVTEIGENAFKNCTGLTSVTIPNTVTGIGQSAFEGCNKLTSVTIPATVTQIGAWAFKNCTNLSKLEFADRTDAINIGIYAFENMALTEVIIPDWMTDISEGLFFNNTKLTAIYLLEQVNTIGHRPFGACPLEYIISMSETPPALPVGEAFEGYNKDASVIVYVPSMDAVAAYQKSDWNKYFTNFITNNTYRILSVSSGTAELVSVIPDEKEKTISIPSVIAIDGDYYRVIGIGDEAFKDNTVLQSISLPPTIQYIGNSAFSGCTQLKQTNSRFWEDLQTIGASAFYGCSALDSIVIPEAVQTIGKSAFMGCSKLTSISLPTGLKNIPDECFKQCPLGQEIIVPEGVETIGKSAFEGTNEAKMNAESLTLPSTLKEINFAAFFFHDGLKGVTCLATTPPTLKDQVFAEYQYQKYKHDSITVYVPNRDVMAAYRDNKNQWGSDLYNFKFSDLMAEEYKQYLYTVAGDNEEAQAIAKAYCDSIDRRATSTWQVEYFTNTALVKIDKYTLSDYKAYLAHQLDSIAKGNTKAERIAEEYGQKVIRARSRQDAEKLFAEGLAKIKDTWDLIYLKDVYCDNLIGSAQGMGDMVVVANDYCSRLQRATSKQEVDNIYKQGSQEIAIYVHKLRYWINSQDGDPCRQTQGYNN